MHNAEEALQVEWLSLSSRIEMQHLCSLVGLNHTYSPFFVDAVLMRKNQIAGNTKITSLACETSVDMVYCDCDICGSRKNCYVIASSRDDCFELRQTFS